MTLFTTLMMTIVLSLVAFKLGALALAGFWAAKGAFSPHGLLVSAKSQAMPSSNTLA